MIVVGCLFIWAMDLALALFFWSQACQTLGCGSLINKTSGSCSTLISASEGPGFRERERERQTEIDPLGQLRAELVTRGSQ